MEDREIKGVYVQARVSEETRRKLKAVAALEGKTLSELLEEAIEQIIVRLEASGVNDLGPAVSSAGPRSA
jgi:predicted DNA-binding protein